MKALLGIAFTLLAAAPAHAQRGQVYTTPDTSFLVDGSGNPKSCTLNSREAYILRDATGAHYLCLDLDSNGSYFWEQVSTGGGPGGGGSFGSITTGTNTTAFMTVGTGAQLIPGGGGVIRATEYQGPGSTSIAIDLATAEVAGVLPLARGGTNQASWVAGRCVQVAGDGSKLEVASTACGAGGATITLEELDSSPTFPITTLQFDHELGFRVVDLGNQIGLVTFGDILKTGTGVSPSAMYLNEGTINAGIGTPDTLIQTIDQDGLTGHQVVWWTNRSGYPVIALNRDPGAGCAQFDTSGRVVSTLAPCAAGGSYAPPDASYLTLGTHAALSGERVLAEGQYLDFVDSGVNGSLTLSMDPTEVAGTTWGSGTTFDWFFNGTGATDPGFRFSGGSTLGSIQLLAALLRTAPQGIEFEETGLKPTCIAGYYGLWADTATGTFRKCENGTSSNLGGLGGSGATNQLAFWTGSAAVGGNTAFTVDTGTGVLSSSGGFASPANATSGGVLELFEDTDLGGSKWGLTVGQSNLSSDFLCTIQADGRIPDACVGDGVDGGGGGGATTFLGLTDTPASYAGQIGKVTRVNTGGTALEFVDAINVDHDSPALASGQVLYLDNSVSPPIYKRLAVTANRWLKSGTTAPTWDSFASAQFGTGSGVSWIFDNAGAADGEILTSAGGGGRGRLQIGTVTRPTELQADEFGIVWNPYDPGDTVASCGASDYRIYATEIGARNRLTKCENGTVTDLDAQEPISVVLPDPVDADDRLIHRTPYGLTFTRIDCIVEGTSTPTVSFILQECSSTGTGCADTHTPITCDGDGAFTTTFSDAAIAAGAWLRMVINGVPGGTVTNLAVTIQADK